MQYNNIIRDDEETGFEVKRRPSRITSTIVSAPMRPAFRIIET